MNQNTGGADPDYSELNNVAIKKPWNLRQYGNKQEFPAFAFKNSEIELKRVMPDKFRRRSQCPIIDSHDSKLKFDKW